MFRNQMPRYDVLSEDAMATLEGGWRRLMTEIGVQFADSRALDLFREAGQKVEDETVYLDPDFVLEQVAKAPREFDVQARNPENNIHIGGDSMAFGAVYGPPFVREGDVRRDGTMEDFRNFARLAQSFDVLDSAGGVVTEPNDKPLDSRHLDMVYALQTLTDKFYMGNVVSGTNAADTIAMTALMPMTMPRLVSPERPLLTRSAARATRMAEKKLISRSQRSEVRGQRSEVRGQKSEGCGFGFADL